MVSPNIGHFNLYKFALAFIAAALSVFLTYIPSRHQSYVYFTVTVIIWLIVAYTVSLKTGAENITELKWQRLIIALPSSLAVAVGIIIFTKYTQEYKRYFTAFAIAITLFILGKSGFIVTELGLTKWDQNFTLLSTAFLIIGHLIEIINLRFEKTHEMHLFSKYMIILGWILFVSSVSYNPEEKILPVIKSDV